MDEEGKELALSFHSEKVAVAFFFLRTSPGTPIRIIKNLGIYLDCHVATKMISKVFAREIVIRDCNRFHHFRDGTCSCKDYWKTEIFLKLIYSLGIKVSMIEIEAFEFERLRRPSTQQPIVEKGNSINDYYFTLYETTTIPSTTIFKSLQITQHSPLYNLFTTLILCITILIKKIHPTNTLKPLLLEDL